MEDHLASRCHRPRHPEINGRAGKSYGKDNFLTQLATFLQLTD